MPRNNYKDKKKVGDYVIFCDICGMKCWASEAVILDKYTGKGGLMVCPMDRDAIDYGLVPYKVDGEKPIPVARGDQYTANPSSVPNAISPSSLDISTTDPTSISNPKTEL